MDRKLSCICSVLEKINEFSSILEFERFQMYIEGLVNRGSAKNPPGAHSSRGIFALCSASLS